MRKHTRILTFAAALLLVGMTAIGMTACEDEPEEDTTVADTTVTETPTEAPTEPETVCENHDIKWTAKDENVHEGACIICGHTPEAAAHEWDEGKVTLEPTIAVDGEKSFACTVCGAERIEAIEKLLNVSAADLVDVMQSLYTGNTVKGETVMFLDKGDTKSLLFPIESIQSITNYQGNKTYEEGKDYVIVDGKLQVTENSSIPCITSEKFYNSPGSIISVNYNGQTVPMHWGEGRAMTDWQIVVNYTHSGTWEDFSQPAQLEIYRNFVQKLVDGEDVTVFFYGDSITYGSNASWLSGDATRQLPYTMLFTQALADLFDYTVQYKAANLVAPNNSMGTCPVPGDYVAGDRGTITYVNTAIGGWTSKDGVTFMEQFITEKVQAYGCDLFVIGFGMNDGGVAPRTTSANVETVVDAVLAESADASVILLATMVPNPAGIGWYGNQPKQAAAFEKLAEKYMEKGTPCAVADMTATSLAILEHKEFHDYSGNNINHPNDFFVRVYAQNLLQTLIGYENLR